MVMGFWSIVGIGFIIAMLVVIVILIVKLFRKMDAIERMEDEETKRRITATEIHPPREH